MVKSAGLILLGLAGLSSPPYLRSWLLWQGIECKLAPERADQLEEARTIRRAEKSGHCERPPVGHVLVSFRNSDGGSSCSSNVVPVSVAICCIAQQLTINLHGLFQILKTAHGAA
jgi:hypothetical protein